MNRSPVCRGLVTRVLTRDVAFAAAVLLCISERGKAVTLVPERDAQSVAFSADGTLAATGKSGLSNSEFPPGPHPSPRKCGVVHVWNVETGKLLRRMETFGDITRVAFSPDGRQLGYSRLFATADGLQMNEVRVWQVNTGTLLKQFDRCYAFDFAPDGKSIAVLSRTGCTLFSLTAWQKLREFAAMTQATDVRFSTDARILTGIVPVKKQYALQAYDVASGELLMQSIGLKDPFYSLAVAPDSRWLATGHANGTVLLWDTDTYRIAARLQTGGQGLQHPFFSPQGSTLASGDQSNSDVVFWDVASGKELHRYTFQRGALRTFMRRGSTEVRRPETDPDRFVFSPDGNAFLSGCYGGMIRAVSDGREIQRFSE